MTMLHDLVKDHDALYFSSGIAEPSALIDELLAEVAPKRDDLRLFQVMTGSNGRLFEAVRHGHHLLTPAPGPLREEAARGEVEVLDLSMRQCAAAIETRDLPFDGALVTAVRFGDEIALVPATDLAAIAFERARFRAVEVLPGWGHRPTGPTFSVADVDYFVEGTAIAALPATGPPSAAARRIGELVADLVPDGAVLELGVGGALAAVAECLVELQRRVAIHSGLVSDWARQLVEGGVATVPLECAGGRSLVAAVAMGSDGFNKWVAETNAVTFADSRHAHDPGHLMGLRPFVAINSAMALDLHGQVGVFEDTSDSHPPGGLLDFAIGGAYGGLSIIAVTSQTRDGRSRIVPRLGRVQLTRSLVSHVVTEYGVAELRGRSLSECRTALLEVAHPDHRAALMEATAPPTIDKRRPPATATEPRES